MALFGILTIAALVVAKGEPGNVASGEPQGSPFREITDSRLVSVERPCMVDQVTVKKFWSFASGKGSTLDEAVDDCKKSLVILVWVSADVECKKYFKIDTFNLDAPGGPQGDPCRAYRGNLDPTTDIEINYKKQDETGWTVGCQITGDVKYTCN